MRPKPHIRHYVASDFPELLSLMTQLQDYFSSIDNDPAHHPFKSPEDAARYLLNALDDARSRQGQCLVAESNARGLVGFISDIILDHAEPNPYYDYTHEKTLEGGIGLLYVHPSFRQTGLAKTMIQRMNQYYAAKSCQSVQLLVSANNLNAIACYERLGFQIIEHKMSLYL